MKEKQYTTEQLESELRDIAELQVVPVNDCKVIVAEFDNDGAGLVLIVNQTEYVLPISRLEASATAYHVHGFAKKAHIPDIYSSYIHLAKVINMQLSRIVLESKQGDVTYGRAIWKDDEGKLFTQVVSPGDACILSCVCGVQLGIVSTLLEELPLLGDWPYMCDIEEW